MNRVVWWFALQPGSQARMMPAGAEPLYASMRQGQPVLYALCDPDAQRIAREVFVVATGDPFEANGFVPVGLIQPEPNLVFHVFVEGRE